MANLDRESPVPLYHQLEQALLELIRLRGLAPGALFPSEHELAAEFGVARLTVRRAVERLAGQGVLRRERGLGTFVADPARATPRSAAGTLTFLLPGMTSIVHLRTLAGAEEEARAHGFQLVVAHADRDPALEARHITAALSSGTAGLLLWPLGGETDRAPLNRLSAAGVPFVLVDRYLEERADDHVVVDDVAGAYAATAHLAELGHRRIALALFEDTDVSAVRLRREGYRRALADHGLVADPTLEVRVPARTEGAVLTAMAPLAEHLVGLSPAPTAAFCVNDHLAEALLVVLERQGVAVPDHFSVAGFDGLAYMPTRLRLTTVHRPTAGMGREAVRLLVSRLHGGSDAPPQRVVLPVELVVGETTAAAPAPLPQTLAAS